MLFVDYHTHTHTHTHRLGNKMGGKCCLWTVTKALLTSVIMEAWRGHGGGDYPLGEGFNWQLVRACVLPCLRAYMCVRSQYVSICMHISGHAHT